VPYAVDNERLLGESKRLQKRRREEKRALGIGESDCTILFVGKLIPKKRPMDLLRAYAMVQSKAKRLIFVGDGELRPELEGYVKEHNISGVRFAGFRNQTELPRYYAASDIFVLPSGTGETWGLVVNEAMCFGLPVVVSDVIGCGPDLVREGENGFVFRAGDVERLASFLNLLARSRAMRATFGKRSSEIIQEYSHEKDVKSVMDALRSL
jgi:glycosyltransferase involved in cell wall biosynthesis